MYRKALLCLSVVCLYVNSYYIQRDRRIINGHPLPAGEVYVYFHNFSKTPVFVYSFKRCGNRDSDVIQRVFLTRDIFQAVHSRSIPASKLN